VTIELVADGAIQALSLVWLQCYLKSSIEFLLSILEEINFTGLYKQIDLIGMCDTRRQDNLVTNAPCACSHIQSIDHLCNS
jgi:hypothetical protein